MKKLFSNKVHSSILALLIIVSMVTQGLTGLQDVFADSTVSITINGYQVNASLQAYRTLYSVIDPSGIIQEAGLVYGLADYATEDELVVGSTNNTVYSYAATANGLSNENHSGDVNGKTYVMTMKFLDSLVFYAEDIMVRAYAKLSDGTYTYSDVSTASVYDIADKLYQDSLMPNEEGHNYLYDTVLSKVNTSYTYVEYSPKTIVEPETTEEITTEEPTTEEVTTPEETTPYLPSGYVEATTEWNNLNYWSVYFAYDWAGNPTGYYRDGNSYNDFSVIIDSASNAEWGIQTKTQPIDVEAGNTYKCTVTAKSNMATTSNIRFKDDVSGTEILKTLTAGTNTFELTFTAGDTAQIFFDLGLAPAGLQFDITSFALTVTEVATTPAQQESTPSSGDVDIDYTSLTYTTLACDGTAGLSLAYAIYSSSVAGLVPWYGDGGNTLSLQFSADGGAVTSVMVNNATAASGVVTESGLGLVKVNPNMLAANDYSVIKVVTDNGEFVIVVKRGDAPPEQPETSVPETTTKTPEVTTEPETEEPTTIPPQNINLDSYYVGIDTASCSTTGEGKETADKLFDNNTGTKMFSGLAMNVDNIRVAWKMSQAVVLESYTFTTANDTASYSYRNPKKWVLYGSNDATTWIQIDVVEDGGMGAENFKDYTYQTDIQESYQFYSVQFTDNGWMYGFQLSEISMYGDVAVATTEIGGDLSQYYAGIDSTNNTFSGYNSEVPANLFDDDTSTKMFTGESLPRSLAWKMDRDVTVYSYSLTTANDNAAFTGRLPKSWTLYGSTNGSNWEQIDRVIDSGMKNVNYTTYTYTVNKVGTYKYFKLDVTAGYGSSFQLSEIDLYGSVISPSEYDILFYKDWHLITNEGYVDELVKLFYNSYPRLYARFGSGTEPKTITFMADSTYDGVAYCAGTTVCVSTAYANANPNDIGFFSHEITHSVQQYGGLLNYGDDVAWWTENMANYGGFRYFHWSNPRYVQVYEASDTSLQDWGYEQYGNNKWFFAYMDAKYPTTKNADGSLNYGLIDSINRLIKSNNTGSAYTDDPYLVGSPFNNVVKQITGYDCIESLRLRYVQELQAGTWTFTGFANYTDNFLTENIAGVPNPEYPMLGEKTHGNKTAAELSYDVTSGTNLALNARIYDKSGQVNNSEAASMLVDGNLGTKWCATSSNLTNPTYALNGVKHFVMLDLGSEKTFNTYTMYNTQSREGYGNATEWEILVSNDAKNWKSVDYQSYNNSAISSFNIGSQTARYVFIKVFTPDNGPGTLRLYEFQLYNQ